MNFLDEQYLENEKERLLTKYNCNSIKEVLAKQEQLMKDLVKKVRVRQKSTDDI